MTTTRTLALAVAAVLVAPASRADDVERLSFDVGPFRAVPTLGLSFSHESNVLRSRTNEVDSFVVMVSPGIRLERGDSQSGVLFGYEADITRYLDVSSENSEDHRVYAQARTSPSARLRIDGTAEYVRGHDVRGETGAQQGPFVNLAREPDEYGQTSLQANVEYGAQGARALVGGHLGWTDLSYRNNREFTEFRDSQEFEFGGRFGLRVGGKTRLLLTAAQREIEFERLRVLGTAVGGGRSVNFDSQERDLMVGVEFDATAKTTGRMSFGHIEKDFDDPLLDDFSGTGWMVGITFKPTVRTAFDLSSSRQAAESDRIIGFAGALQPSFAIARDLTAALSYAWTERLNFSLDAGVVNTTYRALGDSDRTLQDDDLRFFGVGVDYKFRRWLQIGAGYKNYDRDSDEALFDYQRDVFTVSFEGSL